MLNLFSKRRSVSALIVSSFCFGLSAYGNVDLAMVQRYFTIDEVSIEELGTSVGELPTANSFNAREEDEKISLDIIVNTGKAIWAIIQFGKPTVDLKTDFANALPEGSKSWNALHNWQDPISKSYQVTYKNFLGMSVVHFQYAVGYTYGGRFEGKGQYLTNVAIIPSKVEVSWGYKVSAKVQALRITNVGSKDDPTAALQLVLNWKTKSFFSHKEGAEAYYLRGDGNFLRLIDSKLAI